MSLKKLFPWICIGALLVGEVFLFSANRQKMAAQAEARDAKEQLTLLQQQLAEATNSSAQSQSAQLARLRSENQDLRRLRNQIRQLQQTNQQLLAVNRQLRDTNQFLAQQLDAAGGVVQQQQQQLQQAQAQIEQNAQAQADALKLVEANRKACIENLREIEAAKQAWALENNMTATNVPTAEDLLPYFKAGVFPVCPSGGAYSIGAVGDPPVCSFPGHTLPQ